ncbi:MAG: hypothetical protein KatS3mg121_0382 [Gammaproteobacteria bacterium]|nr:MAG: hypothetical protein KatS3mg121_0382 [Gammaproteobacteria bacterium]
MSLWMKIGAALLLGAMVVAMLPAARHWLEHGPRGSAAEWLNAAFVLGLVVLFVLLLMLAV